MTALYFLTFYGVLLYSGYRSGTWIKSKRRKNRSPQTRTALRAGRYLLLSLSVLIVLLGSMALMERIDKSFKRTLHYRSPQQFTPSYDPAQ